MKKKILTGLAIGLMLIGSTGIASATQDKNRDNNNDKDLNGVPFTKLQRQINELQKQLDTLQLNQGIKGDKGDVGPAGPQGIPGEQGPIGLTGQTGPKGDTGNQGIQGVAGPQGVQGFPGSDGTKGDKGDTGDQGPIGLTGPQGEQGLKGDTGATGLTGAVGLKGDQGDQGVQGAMGPQGFPGSDGIDGATGVKGDTGDKGDQGIQGPIGLTGEQGQVGPQGPKGDTGATGQQGEQGIQGAIGLTGTQGVAGPQGDKGDPGTNGIDLTVSPDGTLTLALAQNPSEPYACDPDHMGAIALTPRSTTCACNGTEWVSTTNGTSRCDWDTVVWQGRQWQRSGSQTSMNWNSANAYCANLSEGGYDDWYLPGSDTLRTLVVCSNWTQEGSSYPVSADSCDDGNSNTYNRPTIDVRFSSFSSEYWSSSTVPGRYVGNFLHVGVSFVNGFVDRLWYDMNENDSKYARCVRGGQ